MPDIPKSMVSIINDVYGINCQMFVGSKKGRFFIASKSDVAFLFYFFFKQSKWCVYSMIYNHSNNIKIKVLLRPSPLCMMDGGDVLKI